MGEGIGPIEIPEGGDSGGWQGGNNSEYSGGGNRTRRNDYGRSGPRGPMKRPGWLGQVPGAFNGGPNDISHALKMWQESAGYTDCHFGTGFDANGEPEIKSADAWSIAPSAPETMPSWAYSTTNWQTDHGKRSGDAHAGKGGM